MVNSCGSHVNVASTVINAIYVELWVVISKNVCLERWTRPLGGMATTTHAMMGRRSWILSPSSTGRRSVEQLGACRSVSWYLSQSRDYGKPLLWLATRGQPNWEEENQMRMKLSKVQLHDSLFALRTLITPFCLSFRQHWKLSCT